MESWKSKSTFHFVQSVVLLIMFLPSVTSAQTRYLDSVKCDSLQNLAQRHAQQNLYTIHFYGYPDLSDPVAMDFSNFYDQYLSDSFSINFSNHGCAENMYSCYNNIILDAIKTQYGQNFFDSIRTFIRPLHQRDLQLRIDTGYVFRHTNSPSQFKPGKDSLVRILDCKKAEEERYCGMEFIIDKTGRFEQMVYYMCLENECPDEHIINALMKLEFRPGIMLNQKVKTFYRIEW